MATELCKKEVKVRKQHTCQGCGKRIEIGETVTLSTCADGADIYNFYECVECREWFKSKCAKCQNFDYCIGENYRVGATKECRNESLFAR